MNKEDLNNSSGVAEADSKVMTITTRSQRVEFYIAGAAKVKWDDDFEIETHYLLWFDKEGKPYRVRHNYDYAIPFEDKESVHTITITGENVTHLVRMRKHIRTIDASDNTALEVLECKYNWVKALDVSGCTAIRRINCSFNQLSADALNALFETLHENTFPDCDKIIAVFGNPGSKECDRSIAERKGWEVK